MKTKAIREVAVQGSSMEPRLRHGDYALIVPQNQYRIGDIVLFPHLQEGLLLHRIVKIDELNYFCKGDNAFRLERVTKDCIIGCVRSVRRGSRTSGIRTEEDVKPLCDASVSMYYLALRHNWEIEKIKNHPRYLAYRDKYLKSKEDTLPLLALQLLRSIYGKTPLPLPEINEYKEELFELFRYHKIAELLSPLNEPEWESFSLKAKLLQRKNQQKHELRMKAMQPIFDKITFPYAVIKGPVLGRTAYSHASFRPSADVDILIPKAHLKEMDKLLKSYGFLQGYPDENGRLHEYTREQKLFYLTATHQAAPYLQPTDNKVLSYLNVDLNFSLTWGEYEGRDISIPKYLTDRKEFCWNETTRFYTLSSEKALIQYCLHTYKEMNSIYLLAAHNSISLRSFCDIYGLIIRAKPDLKKVISICAELDILPFVLYVLYYTAQIMNAPELIEPFEEFLPEHSEILESFGLCGKERKPWSVSFEERLFSRNRLALLYSQLTKQDLEKIQNNQKYL